MVTPEEKLSELTKEAMLARLNDWYDLYIHEMECSEQGYTKTKFYHDKVFVAIRDIIKASGKTDNDKIPRLDFSVRFENGRIWLRQIKIEKK